MLTDLFDAQNGVATSGQILRVISRRTMQSALDRGDLWRVWPGIYSLTEPDNVTLLRGLDLRAGEPVAICLGTAAPAYGFDTEDVRDLHVLNPIGRLWRVDFAWPECRVAVEYDGYDWHSGPDDFARDRRKRAALTELGWTVISIVSEDVREDKWATSRRIKGQLLRSAA